MSTSTERSAQAEFAFNDWAQLAKDDPDAFERERAKVIDEFIESVSEEKRMQLRRLQWRIDQVRRRAKTPMAACIKISEMMWDSVVGPNGLLENLQRLSDVTDGKFTAAAPLPKATVLPFARPRERSARG